MYANDPEMAARFEKHTPKGKKLPKYAPKKKKKKKASEYLSMIKQSSMIKTASIIRLSSREFVHCPVCGKSSSAIGTHGPSKKYACGTCDYRFSNK
jgi:ribosomal protein S27AE